MAKSSTIFFCTSCGNEFPKWSGQCPACHQWNTLSEGTSLLSTTSKKSTRSSKPAEILNPKEALKIGQATSFSSGISELDNTLGSGLTIGGVYLLAGQPGIGKSTILTQLALSQKQPILYICSEENPSQVAARIHRLQSKNTDHIHLLNSSIVEEIIHHLESNTYSLIIVDSIQSVATNQNPTTAGSPSQIRDSATLLISTAKKLNIPMFLVGHVTKTGTLAGPKLLEHMVDVVLELSGDRQHRLRLLRTLKNRFGPTDETGIFEMKETGLESVSDPSKLLLDGRIANAPGSALTLIMEGTRPLTVEVQALVTQSTIPIPRRVAKGISTAHLQLICAILTKHLHLPLGDKDVFVNLTGGLTCKDPGLDLGLALAIISSTKNKPLPNKSICFGELGLLGEIRNVSYSDKRLKEAKHLGYISIFSPAAFPTLKNTLKLI